uniref:Uncharacterized protein n=1 Tax=Acidicaldus sp. TaxID=1872105 RepID=A0A8J4HBH8_9PROT
MSARKRRTEREVAGIAAWHARLGETRLAMVGLLALLLAGCGAGGWATYSETTADDGDMGGLFDDLGGMDLGGMDLGGMAPDFMGAGMDAFGGGMPGF